jgi:hypothetical protein
MKRLLVPQRHHGIDLRSAKYGDVAGKRSNDDESGVLGICPRILSFSTPGQILQKRLGLLRSDAPFSYPGDCQVAD